jgi:hypothetical protein
MTSNDDNADQPATAVGDSSDATTIVPPPTEAAPESAETTASTGSTRSYINRQSGVPKQRSASAM